MRDKSVLLILAWANDAELPLRRVALFLLVLSFPVEHEMQEGRCGSSNMAEEGFKRCNKHRQHWKFGEQ